MSDLIGLSIVALSYTFNREEPANHLENSLREFASSSSFGRIWKDHLNFILIFLR
jgi:hypothetical protein